MTVTHDARAAESALVGIGTNGGKPLDEHPLPFWAAKPCPAWCRTPHKTCDSGLMRAHMTGQYSVMLTLEPGGELSDSLDPSVEGWAASAIDLSMHQGYREAAPYLHFMFACDAEPNLTVDEGAAFAALLRRLADSAPDMADGMSPKTEERPFWLTGSCPAWCREGHRHDNYPDDRHHIGEYHTVYLAMEDPYKGLVISGDPWMPQELQAALEQDWREAEPHIVICVFASDKYYALSLAEARELADDITALVTAAQGTA